MTEIPPPPIRPAQEDGDDLPIQLGPSRPSQPKAETEPADLACGDVPPAPEQPAAGDVLVIDAADLDDVDADLPAAGDYYPPVQPGGVDLLSMKAKQKGAFGPGTVVGSNLVPMMAAAALGAFVAWSVLEPGMRASELGRGLSGPSAADVLGRVALFGGALGGFVGLALGAVEGVVMGAWSRAASGGALGLLIGGLGGALGGMTGQVLFSAILTAGRGESGLGLGVQTVAARAFGWALVGAFVGLGPGVQLMAQRKIVNGLLGGLLGGFIGGLLFDPIGQILGSLGPMAGTPSRFVGMIVLGLCTGLGIGLVEEMRKEAWLIIVAGPLAGKQFILYKSVTYIGSAPAMDVPLVKDRGVAPKQCIIEIEGSRHVLRDLTGGRTLVNGRPAVRLALHDQDAIGMGNTTLEFHLRPMSLAGKA